MFFVLLLVCCLAITVGSVRVPMQSSFPYGVTKRETNRPSPYILAAILPGDPLITGTLSQGAVTTVGLFSNIILARFALSWFPQVLKQFPFLKPIITVTEPYLKVFRKRIPPVGGFDISAIPAIFILDILGQATAALGAEFPKAKKPLNKDSRILPKEIEIRSSAPDRRALSFKK